MKNVKQAIKDLRDRNIKVLNEIIDDPEVAPAVRQQTIQTLEKILIHIEETEGADDEPALQKIIDQIKDE